MSSTGLTRRWQADIGGEIQRSKPAVSEALVFSDSLDPTVYALDRETGETAWTAPRDGALSDSSPVFHDGRVYVGSGGGSVHTFEAATGEESWRYTGDSAIVSSPAVHEGTVYVGRNDGTVLALVDGSVEWESELPGPIYAALSYDSDLGYVYVTTDAGTLYALDATAGGRRVWQKQSHSDVSSASPVLDSSRGVVYFAANEVMALDAATGEPDWITSFYGTNAGAAPAFDDERVYAGGANGNVYGLDARGGTIRASPDWTVSTRQTFAGDLALADGHIVAVSLEGTLYTIEASTGEVMDTTELPAETHSSPVIANDQVIIGTRDGSILAYDWTP